MTRLVLMLLQLALAIGIPALIARFAPRRWRLWAVGLWALAPVLIALALAGSEIASGKASPADLDKLIYGLLLIGSFLLLPWLIACAAGFALGAMLRGRARPKPAAPVPAPPPEEDPSQIAEAPAADTDGPTLAPPCGWQAAHVGFDGDDLVLDGLPVWSLSWRKEETTGPVQLAHPAHPNQQHVFTVYSIDDGGRAARFAAAELSNGVWGFYRWVAPADAPAGTSADGALRYEHDLGPQGQGRYDSTAPVARLHDQQTQALLFDGAAWRSSRIVPQADGSLLLSLEHAERQTIFQIDPAARAFRDLAAPEALRPLADLAGAAAAARAACDDPANTYLGRRVAPDGSLLVELQSVEWGNSHWVRSPRVIDIATGRVLLDLWGTDWDAWPSFPRPRTVRLSFRRYHFGGAAEAELELGRDRYTLFESSGLTVGPLRDLPRALEDAARRVVAEAPPRQMIPPPRPTARNWLVALLILVGALALIAVATLVTLRLQGQSPPPKLDTIPPMPGKP
jgi:hypothetical protein